MYISVMAKRYSIAEARSNLPAIIDQAEAGLEIELTRHGKPVAVLLSPGELERRRSEGRGFNEAYGKFLGKYSLKDVGIGKKFARSVRQKGFGRKVVF
jgi:prevent-host-death family protein